MMMTGTIIGEIRSATTTFFKGKLLRTSPSAASVPRGVARIVVATATTKLFCTAESQRGEVKKSSYQRSDRPSSGYVRKGPLLKESGTMTTIGATRKRNTSAQKARKPKRAARSSGEGSGGRNISARSRRLNAGQPPVHRIED